MTNAVNEATAQIERAASTARETLSEAAGQASQTVRRAAEGQRERGADAIESIARALQIAARELGGSAPLVGRYVDDAAGSLARASHAVRDQSAPELLRRTTEFARQQPMVTFASAVLAGIAMSRFIKSTAQRSGGASLPSSTPRSPESEQWWDSRGAAGSSATRGTPGMPEQSDGQRLAGGNPRPETSGIV